MSPKFNKNSPNLKNSVPNPEIAEISTADASHLQALVDFQNPKIEAHIRDIGAIINSDGFDSKPVGPPLTDQFSNMGQQQQHKRPETRMRKKQKINKQQLHGRPNAPCVPVNETMRKYLTQVVNIF